MQTAPTDLTIHHLSRRLLAAAAAIGFVAGAGSCRRGELAARASRSSLPPAFEVRVPKPPTVTRGSGEAVLPYELHVTNFTGQTVTLQRVEVLNADDGTTLFALTDSALQSALRRPGGQIAPSQRASLAPGLRAVVFLWVPIRNGAPPRAVRHRLTAAPDTGAGPLVLETPAVPVIRDQIVIAPPLEGGVWFAGNGPAPESAHRRAMIALFGTYYIAQRFAIDWVKVDERNQTHTGDPLENSSYYAYGSSVKAVADGIVTEVKDSIPENVPGLTSRAVPITLETIGGNHVIIDIGGGHYAFYAHLQPGSIRVHVGDHVQRGQVLGLVGNSGNSTGPHLHFHITDASSPLGAEGIPYTIESFELVGRCRQLGGPCTRTTPIVRRGEMPFANELVMFP